MTHVDGLMSVVLILIISLPILAFAVAMVGVNEGRWG